MVEIASASGTTVAFYCSISRWIRQIISKPDADDFISWTVWDPGIPRVGDWDDTGPERRRLSTITRGTEGGQARCPRVNLYDRWFSDMLISARALRVMGMPRPFIHRARRTTPRPNFAIDKPFPARIKIRYQSERQDKGDEGDEARGWMQKYNSIVRYMPFVLFASSHLHLFSPHKDEIRIKGTAHN